MSKRVENGGAVEAGRDLAAWLQAAATYFEKRPTNGEDRAHWANVFNAENCRAAAAEITRLRAENAWMREALEEAETFIDGLRQDLFSRRVADWYPEGAHNAAEAMSEDMRLLGNACAGFDARAALSKASQAEGQTP